MSEALNAALAEGQESELTVLAVAAGMYRDAGLRMPPVPLDLAEALDDQPGEWRFGTADLPLESRADFEAAATNPATPPQVAFGHLGHGVSSWWLCYRLIRPSLALYVRQSYGGVYDKKASSAAVVNTLVPLLEDLIVTAEAAQASGRFPADQRLIVAVDDLEGGSWRVGNGPENAEEGIDPVIAALAFVSAP